MVYVPVYSGQWLNGTLYMYLHVYITCSGQWLNGIIVLTCTCTCVYVLINLYVHTCVHRILVHTIVFYVKVLNNG